MLLSDAAQPQGVALCSCAEKSAGRQMEAGSKNACVGNISATRKSPVQLSKKECRQTEQKPARKNARPEGISGTRIIPEQLH